jgi:Mn2+/Fe2+ NRAMP family transporter
VEEEEARGWTTVEQREASVSDTDLKNVAWDVNIGMAFANIVFYFIILTAATTLFKAGKTDIQSAADAAQALAPLAGNAATILFAIGIIGAGFLAVPVLTASGAYPVCEAAGWSYGLSEKLSKAKHFYIVIFAATVVGVLFNFVGINPITALFWTAIINGLLAPPLLVVIMLISNNKAVMGTRTNSWLLNVLGWAATAIMFTAASALIVSWRAGS